jgi:CheY-like chemotaxis protein
LVPSTGEIVRVHVHPDQLRGVQVLVVDDIKINCDIMSRQLDAMGMVATCVEDGFAAMAELERAWHRGKPYDMVLVDQMMPGLSGDDLGRRIRATPHLSDIKLVLNSSAGRHGLGSGASRIFDAVLEKPVRQHELSDCLVRLHSSNPSGGHESVTTVETSPGAARSEPTDVTSARRPVRILLAEDNKFNQQFAIALLRKAGHEVDLAQNGHEAVSAVQHGDYDVVLMDVQMPDLDGIQATRQIRALPAPKCDIPIIALTAHAMAGAKEEYLGAGMNDYVSKPIRPELLLSKLADLEIKELPSDADDEPAACPDSVLEGARLNTLLSVFPIDGVRGFIEEYLENIEVYLTEVRRHAAGGDLAALSAAAHTIVGVAGNVGAMHVSKAASAIELASKSANRTDAERLAGEIDAASRTASAELRLWLSRNLSAA